MYKTEDIGYFTPNGDIICLGRSDNQVKLRGLRVELDEIEKVLNSYPGISNSVILVKTNPTDGDYLAAYFVASKQVDKDDLTAHMSKSLTPYMIPKVMMQLEKIPLTPNGKVDKKALPEPYEHLQRGRSFGFLGLFCPSTNERRLLLGF